MSKTKNPISKSPDYPIYERMKRKNPKAALYWIVGDRLYHAGLILTMLSIPALFFAYTQTEPAGILPWLIGGMIVPLGIFILGIIFKREAYKLAIQNGMDLSNPV